MVHRDKEERNKAMLIKSMRVGTLNLNFMLVLMWVVFKNKGVDLFLDTIVNYLPSLGKIEAIEGINKRTREEVVYESSNTNLFSVLMFKAGTMYAHAGKADTPWRPLGSRNGYLARAQPVTHTVCSALPML